MIGMSEILVIVLIFVLIFGSTQIPKLARSLGEGLKELKKSMKEAREFDNAEEKKTEEKKS